MYAFSVELDLPFDAAIERLREAMTAEHLGVVSDVDVQAILRAKLGEERTAYRLLGACAAGLAKRVLDAEPDAGALLPCTVAVRETDAGRVAITFMDPEPVLALADSPEVAAVAAEARERLLKVRDRLAAG